MSKQSIDNCLNQTVLLEPAAAGVSGLQKTTGARSRRSACWWRWCC